MYNLEHKNWNNFALGLLVMFLPLLALPQTLVKFLLIASGFFIALFSLAQVGRLPNNNEKDQPPSSPTSPVV